MLNNNKINLILIKDSKSQNQIKHINIIHHYICKLVKDKKLAINWIKRYTIFADSLTKTFFTTSFKKYQGKQGLIE